MPDDETYDVWVISDPDGPVLYFPVSSDSAASPDDHVTSHRRLTGTTRNPEGLIEGVWERTRRRLAAPAERLVAEIADPEVETRRAAQRAATMARGADAAAWAPNELLTPPEPARPAPRPSRSSAAAGSSSPTRSVPKPARAKRAPAARPKPKPAPEPEEQVCRACYMMRRTDMIDADGICDFCR